MNFLSDLDKGDAGLFTGLCGFGWMIGNVVPLVYDEQHPIYTNHGINFGALIHLESIALIQFQTLGFTRLHLPKTFVIFYYGTPVELRMPVETDNILAAGKVMLTKVGQELAPICGSKPVDGFLDYMIEKWQGQGYIIDDKAKPNDDTNGVPPSADIKVAEEKD